MIQPSASSPPGRRFALLIGVDHAPDARDIISREMILKASQDANDMAEVLQKKGKFQIWGGKPLLNGDATSRAIQDAIATMERQSTRDDLLLFYFSGHGQLLTPQLRRRATIPDDDQTMPFLATWDFFEDMAEEHPDFHLSVNSWLRDTLYYSTRAGKVVIILDCCYAGYMNRASDSTEKLLLNRMSALLKAPDEASGSPTGAARQALLATGHRDTTGERQGHGFMTSYLLPTLRGEVDSVIDIENDGAVTVGAIREYLGKVMYPQEPSLTGDDAGQRIILVWDEQRARELQRLRNSQWRPHSYIPAQQLHAFLQRPDELEGEARLLRRLASVQQDPLHIMGLIGAPGIGKSSLAAELARTSFRQERYPGGVFWLSAGDDDYATWQHELAQVARRAGYISPSENEEQLACDFCRYLAKHADALLIIDDMKNALPITDILPNFAGGSLNCTIVYTAIELKLDGASIYEVRPFNNQPFINGMAMTALLQTARPALLQIPPEQARNSEHVGASRGICGQVDHLPLALTMLHTVLEDTPALTPTDLLTLLNERKAAGVSGRDAALQLGWELIRDERQRQLFLLATLFPSAIPLPFWLLKLAAGFRESAGDATAFASACHRLEMLHWIAVEREEQQVRLSRLQREFGLQLLRKDPSLSESVTAEAGKRLVRQWCDINNLQANMQASGYRQGLGQVRQVRAFAWLLGEQYGRAMESIERRLDQESMLLMDETGWPQRLPVLFYQQLYNRAVEEESPPSAAPVHLPWLRLEQPVGAEDRSLLRIFSGHQKGIRCVAFSPDGEYILTGSNDQTARLWRSANGRLHAPLKGHHGSVTCATFSGDGESIMTGSDDRTIRVWNRHGSLRSTLQGHNAAITCIACSADGSTLVSGSNDRSIRIWDVHEGKHLKRCWLAPSRISALVLDEHRELIIFASGDTVWRWDCQTRRSDMLRQFPHTLISSLALSPDGQTLAIGMLDSPVVHLWDCDGRFIRRTLAGHTQWINSLVFSPDGKWLLTGANDETARLWDSESGKCRAILMGHTGAITSVAYAPGRLLTGSIDYTAHLWDEEMARGTQQVCALNASPANGTALQTLFAMNGTTGSGLSFAEQKRVYFAPGGASALVFDGRNAELWNTEKRTCLVSMSMRTIEWLKYSLDGHYLLIGRPRGLRAYRCIDGKVEENGGYKQWDEYLAPALPLTHPPGEPISVTTADLRYRISASHQGRLICEKIALPPTNSTEQMVETEAVCITHLSFSPGEQFLLVSNTAGRLFFFAWDGNAIGSLLGLYQVYGQVAGLSWLSHDRLILADIGPGLLPHFHRLHLEDIWR